MILSALLAIAASNYVFKSAINEPEVAADVDLMISEGLDCLWSDTFVINFTSREGKIVSVEALGRERVSSKCFEPHFVGKKYPHDGKHSARVTVVDRDDLSPAGSQIIPPERSVVVVFDRFKNRTIAKQAVVLQTPPRLAPIASLLLYAFDGNQPLTPARPLTWAMKFSSPDWRYLKCHDVAMLIDGHPAATGEVHHDGDVVRGGVVETLMFEVPPETLEAMAESELVELRVCRDEMRLAGDQPQLRLKALISYQRPALATGDQFTQPGQDPVQ